jgi:hypothetical protein
MRKILLTGVVGGLLAALLIGSVKERDPDVKEPTPFGSPFAARLSVSGGQKPTANTHTAMTMSVPSETMVRARKGSESIDPNYWPRATFLMAVERFALMKTDTPPVESTTPAVRSGKNTTGAGWRRWR